MEEKLVGRGEGGGGEGDKKVELVEWERWTVLHPASELTETRACKATKQVPLVSVILSQQRFCLKFFQNRFQMYFLDATGETQVYNQSELF